MHIKYITLIAPLLKTSESAPITQQRKSKDKGTLKRKKFVPRP